MSNVVIIEGLTIRQDKEGRYCLNDLQKAATIGRNSRTVELNEFIRRPETQDLIKQLNTGNSRIIPIESYRGRYGGTYVVKELVYAYAMWISPEFHLKVIRAFDTLQTKGVAVADHAAADFLKNPIPFVEILLDQAKKLQAECEVLGSKLAVAEKELNLVTVDEYRALTHRYMPQGMKIKLGRKATAIMREKGMEVVKQERVLGERVCSVNVYPRHILEQAEQLIASN